jgi:hypothetical protein
LVALTAPASLLSSEPSAQIPWLRADVVSGNEWHEPLASELMDPARERGERSLLFTPGCKRALLFVALFSPRDVVRANSFREKAIFKLT